MAIFFFFFFLPNVIYLKCLKLWLPSVYSAGKCILHIVLKRNIRARDRSLINIQCSATLTNLSPTELLQTLSVNTKLC